MKKAAKKFLAWMTALGFVLGSASATEPAENGENTGINGGDTCPHIVGDPVRDTANEIPSTCQEPGFYDMVWYCTICGQEVFRETIDLEDLAPHTPGDAVKENETPATCTEDGSYDLVRYCTVCEEEVSRETVVVKAAHTPGEAVKENETPATCEHPGSYDLVRYCTVCGEGDVEVSRETVATNPLPHTPGEVVKEKETAATCEQPGSYDLARYCTVCGAEVSRETKATDKLPHTPGEAVKENENRATCYHTGSYDLVQYCTVCGAEVSRETKEIEKEDHVPGEAQVKNEVAATCEHPGGYDLVQYCMVCGAEVAARHFETAQKEHVAGEGVRENEKEANCDGPESYDLVVYCSVCGAELSRRKITTGEAVHFPSDPEDDGRIFCAACGALLGYAPVPDPAPAPDPAPKPEPVPVPEPARPVAPVSPADSAAINYAMEQITDVDAFAENLIIDLAKDGKAMALDTDSLKAVLKEANNPPEEQISVESALEALGGNYKSYRTNGKEAQDDPNLSEYCFLCGFEQLKLQDKQETDRYGNPLPFEVKAAFPALADLKPDEINNTVMLVLNPESGQIALIQLDMSCMDTSKNPPELNVTLPFDGLVTFVQK